LRSCAPGKGVIDLHFGGAHGVNGEISNPFVSRLLKTRRHQLIGIQQVVRTVDSISTQVAGASREESLLGNFVAEDRCT